MTAVSPTLAVIHSKTRVSDDGRYRDIAGNSNDPAPGIGLDDETPVGDTDQHSDVIEARPAGRSVR